MKKILQYVDPASVIMFLLGVPFLVIFGNILQNLQPTQIFYSVFSGRFLGLPLSIPFLFLVTGFWFFLRKANKWQNNLGKISKFIGRAILVVGILIATLLSYAVGFASPYRYDVGDIPCDILGLGEVKRCEGMEIGMLGDSLWAVSRFGDASAYVIKKIETLPDYELFQTDCKDLPGDFGETCYAGWYQRKTHDLIYLNIYLHKDKILLLETKNILINKASLGEPAYAPGQEPKLEDFVDLERFRKDMTE